MPRNRAGRFIYALLVCALLSLIGRNLYHRYLNNRLIAAVEQKDVVAVRDLLARGADANARPLSDKGSRTDKSALDSAIYQEEIACLLLQHGAASHLDKKTLTEHLVTACSNGSLTLARCLLEHGASPYPPYPKYLPPMDAAIGYRSVTQFVMSSATTPSAARRRASSDAKQMREQQLKEELVKEELDKKRRLEVSQELVRLLEQYGAVMNAQQAIDIDDTKTLRARLDEGTPVDDRGLPTQIVDFSRGKTTTVLSPTLLTLAAQQGSIACVRLLLERGANVNAISQYPSCPLMGAINAQHLEIARLLLQKGADVNLKSSNSSSIAPTLLAAACYSLPELVPELLRQGVNVQEQGGKALEIALQHHPELVSSLLQHGASAKGKEGYQVLTAAIQCRPDLVPLFLQQGADAHEAQNGDAQLITLAAHYGRKELIMPLLQAGAKLQSPTKYVFFGGQQGMPTTSTSPLIEALGQKLDTLELLLKLGVDPNIATSSGQFPLTLAAQAGRVKTTRLLLKYGAKVDGWSTKQHTPLYYARRHKHTAVVALLEQVGGHDR